MKYQNLLKVTDKVIIVTGAAGGIGSILCQHLVGLGAKIVAADIKMELVNELTKKISANSSVALPVKVDVSSETEVRLMVQAALNTFGRIDVLLNVAAIYEGLRKQPFDEISSQEWDNVLSVNVKGVWICSKAVVPQFKKQGKGKIINVTSSSFFTGITGFPHYVASKGAVIGLTRALAKELGDYNITVNAIAPGYTETKASLSLNPVEFSNKMVGLRSIKKKEYPEDLVGAFAFLCSDASDFVSGQTMIVDGGFALN
ncbi:MAG: SDR family oxidoreductase [Thaumarchaeota archaeon]|nr:SDR family oxidoreductase [Nitrososphaerota archaeon]